MQETIIIEKSDKMLTLSDFVKMIREDILADWIIARNIQLLYTPAVIYTNEPKENCQTIILKNLQNQNLREIVISDKDFKKLQKAKLLTLAHKRKKSNFWIIKEIFTSKYTEFFKLQCCNCEETTTIKTDEDFPKECQECREFNEDDD
ncbi:hypothetical protein ES704_03013 [subsurface metagenome]|jgi:hypothetical protein